MGKGIRYWTTFNSNAIKRRPDGTLYVEQYPSSSGAYIKGAAAAAKAMAAKLKEERNNKECFVSVEKKQQLLLEEAKSYCGLALQNVQECLQSMNSKGD